LLRCWMNLACSSVLILSIVWIGVFRSLRATSLPTFPTEPITLGIVYSGMMADILQKKG
jgi:hypothetical protein